MASGCACWAGFTTVTAQRSRREGSKATHGEAGVGRRKTEEGGQAAAEHKEGISVILLGGRRVPFLNHRESVLPTCAFLQTGKRLLAQQDR